MKQYDFVIIGGGPGGYVAAIRASANGKTVALIEERDLGGTCLNRGCIPSKTLLRHAEVIETIEKAKGWGIEASIESISFEKMLKRKDNVIRTLRSGITALMKKGKIDVINGTGMIKGQKTIEIAGTEGKQVISADKIIVATGSSPVVPPIKGVGDVSYYTSDTIFDIKEIPKHILIVGGGVIGVEFACIFAALQTKVTIIEMGERIIPSEDEEASQELHKHLVKKGVSILTKAAVTELKKATNGIEVLYKDNNGQLTSLEVDTVLLSVGRKPNLSAVQDANLEMNGSFIKVNPYLETSSNGIYAIGDVIGGTQLAHKASAEGNRVVDNACGQPKKMDYTVVPRCIYTYPEVASVGLTELEAKEKGIDYKVSKVDLRGNGKAIAMDEAAGFVKVIAEKQYGEILGVVMVGPHVTEMISEPAAFIHLEGTMQEMAEMIHPHPTISEALYEAAAAWIGKGVHA